MLDTVGCLRILVIARSAALRLRLRHTLGNVDEAALLDQTADTAEGIRLAQRLSPHLILCDAPVAADPVLLALFTGVGRRPTPKVILLDDAPAQSSRGYPVPLAAILPSDLPAAELVAYLSTMVDAHAPVKIAHPPEDDRPPRPWTTPAAPLPARRASDHGWSPTSNTQEPAPSRKRAANPAPMPPTVGPTDQQALERAAQVLVNAMYPLSIVVVELCEAPGSTAQADGAAVGRLTQLLETTMRQSVRRDDMVCTLESLTCAALLPGLLREQQGLITNRLADALQNAGIDRHGGVHLLPAIGIASWEPVQPEIDLLHEARAASSAARATLLRRYQPAATW